MITSSDNKTFKLLKSLLSSKGLAKSDLCLVSGARIVKELKTDEDQTISFLESDNPDILFSKELFKEIDILGTHRTLLLKRKPNLTSVNSLAPVQDLEVVLPAGDPKNLGALVRTALAFNVSKIYLTQEAANPFLPTAIKASSGAVFKASLFKLESLESLSNDPRTFSLDGKGVPLDSVESGPVRLILGEEGGRLPQELLQNSISIPISSQVESLNVNAALSIALYALGTKFTNNKKNP